MQYSTAYNSMVDVAQLQKGEYVLLTAATSSVGIAAIQIAKSLGAIPICTTRSQTKVAALKARSRTCHRYRRAGYPDGGRAHNRCRLPRDL
jgi:NADPH:quinone reductase-like Zn-dependent oxidoreductase